MTKYPVFHTDDLASKSLAQLYGSLNANHIPRDEQKKYTEPIRRAKGKAERREIKGSVEIRPNAIYLLGGTRGNSRTRIF